MSVHRESVPPIERDGEWTCLVATGSPSSSSHYVACYLVRSARMAESADAEASKVFTRKGVWVQVPLRARVVVARSVVVRHGALGASDTVAKRALIRIRPLLAA